jgi:hypothetical protein
MEEWKSDVSDSYVPRYVASICTDCAAASDPEDIDQHQQILNEINDKNQLFFEQLKTMRESYLPVKEIPPPAPFSMWQAIQWWLKKVGL